MKLKEIVAMEEFKISAVLAILAIFLHAVGSPWFLFVCFWLGLRLGNLVWVIRENKKAPTQAEERSRKG